jgi:serine/threonine protein kinase
MSSYRVTSQIGVGAFAVVYKAEHLPSGQRVAIKAIPKVSSNISQLKAEINVLKTIKVRTTRVQANTASL